MSFLIQTPELQRWSERYKATNRRNSLKSYHRLKAKADKKIPLTEGEHIRLQANRKTKEWRDKNPTNQARYENHLRRNRERRKTERDRKALNEQGSLQKRAFDLNKTPEPESESSSRPRTVNAGLSKKRKEVSQPEVSSLPTKRRRRDPQKELIRQRWKEAQNDPSKMTPEIQKAIDQYELKKLKSKRSHAELMERVRTGEELTHQQKKRYGYLFRTKEWRESSEANKAKYEEILLKKSSRYRRTKIESQTKKGLDLNAQPVVSDQDNSPLNRQRRVSTNLCSIRYVLLS